MNNIFHKIGILTVLAGILLSAALLGATTMRVANAQAIVTEPMEENMTAGNATMGGNMTAGNESSTAMTNST